MLVMDVARLPWSFAQSGRTIASASEIAFIRLTTNLPVNLIRGQIDQWSMY